MTRTCGWWVLHCNYASLQMAHLVRKWIERHDIEVMVHPAQPRYRPVGFLVSAIWEAGSSKLMRKSFTKFRKVWLAYPWPNFTEWLKKNMSKGWNGVLAVEEDTSKKRVAIRMIPNVKMMICNRFQYSFSFLTFSRPLFGRGRLTFVYKIVHISACISHTEVIEHLLDTSWIMEDVCFKRIATGCTTGP